MADVDRLTKQKLEHLLGMGGGYVLDFSNARFADFVQDSIGINPYEVHDGSKAQVLRQLWLKLPNDQFARLSIDMLEYRRLAEDLGRRPIPYDEHRRETDRRLAEEVADELRAMQLAADTPTIEEAQFLARDFGALDLERIQAPLDYQAVISDRLREIGVCHANGAALAVVVLCGSTLEGLLYRVAVAHPERFNRASAAPRRDGKVRPLREWTLQDLLQASRELSILGEDVVKYADAVREFRNYIHPQQQVRENFRPRAITAQMARQVLRAAIDDLARLAQDA